MVRQNERANLLKETRQAQLLTIENRKNQNISERKNLVMFEKEISEARKEENKLHSEREKVQEREKREALKRDLEIQIQNKIQQKTEYLNDKNNYNNGSFLNINNQYNNPYLPNRREYFIEIERQKQNKRERSLKEKEV